jgi:uncharacterized protein YcnI
VKTILLIAALLAGAAQAHVTFEVPQAAAGASYKGVLRVGHGCQGSPTRGLVVRIPAGFDGAKPMPKAGWALTVKRSGDQVTEIAWRAKSREAWIDDGWYDEFVLRGRTPKAAAALSFAVVQQCEKGDADWSADLNVTGEKP